MLHSAIRPILSKELRVAPTSIDLSMLNATALFEDAVRSATGSDDYKFGDWTRGKIKELSGKELEEYKFGDITKRLAAQAAGKDPDEGYEFGDISKRLADEAKQSLATFAGKVL